ncbi:MAG: hypothetical protein RIQ93_123 [Verrucomicrobiota bacterium]|jgi:HPt (histidine-containing phosphotransfer) domain-containing protein
MGEPIIDLQTIEDLRSLNPGDNNEFLREIVVIFLADTPLRIAELDQSLGARDATKFIRAAHSIKGSSAILGALLLRTAAERLEYLCRTDGFDNLATPIAEVKTEFARAMAELARLIAK